MSLSRFLFVLTWKIEMFFRLNSLAWFCVVMVACACSNGCGSDGQNSIIAPADEQKLNQALTPEEIRDANAKAEAEMN